MEGKTEQELRKGIDQLCLEAGVPLNGSLIDGILPLIKKALPELAKEAGYLPPADAEQAEYFGWFLEHGWKSPDMLEREGYVKLADQTLPKEPKSYYGYQDVSHTNRAAQPVENETHDEGGKSMKRICPKAKECESLKCHHIVEHESMNHYLSCAVVSSSCPACVEVPELARIMNEDGTICGIATGVNLPESQPVQDKVKEGLAQRLPGMINGGWLNTVDQILSYLSSQGWKYDPYTLEWLLTDKEAMDLIRKAGYGDTKQAHREEARYIGEALCCLAGNIMLEDMEKGKWLAEKLNPIVKDLQTRAGINFSQEQLKEWGVK